MQYSRTRNEKLITTFYEFNATTHAAANDSLANIVPNDTDVEVDDEDECKEIIVEVMGKNTIPEAVVVTHPAPKYALHIRDDGGSTHEITFTEEPDKSDIHREIENWCKDGEWGDDGAAIDILWTLELDGDEIDEGFYTVDIEPNHSKLIWDACGYIWDETGKKIRGCGDDPEDHDWTAEGEGGCMENPGVWSTGGTSMSFSTHCRKCGLHRNEYRTGSQRNPGEHDTVSYKMSDTWCEICEDEECRYKYPNQYIRYSDCDDDIPNGDELASFNTFEEAQEFAKEYAHEHNVKDPDLICIALDNMEDGDGDYHVFFVD